MADSGRTAKSLRLQHSAALGFVEFPGFGFRDPDDCALHGNASCTHPRHVATMYRDRQTNTACLQRAGLRIDQVSRRPQHQASAGRGV